MRKFLAILFGATVLVAGPCAVDSWKLAFGPMISGETAYVGVEVELQSGLDFIIPMGSLGDNLGN